MSSETPFIISAILLIGALAIGINRWQMVRGKEMLENWCRQARYELLSLRRCWILRGPFFWTSSKGQIVFQLSVRDTAGRVRSGYARCGGYWLGVFTDHVDVRWDA